MNNGPVTKNDRGTLREKLMSNPELTLPSVAAAIPKGHTIRIIHENYEDIDSSNGNNYFGSYPEYAPVGEVEKRIIGAQELFLK